MTDLAARLNGILTERFGETAPTGDGLDPGPSAEAFAAILGRRSCRSFQARAVDDGLVRLLIAAGLSAPTKSDLQQADVIRVSDPELRTAILDGVSGAEWMATAPEFLVVCADGQRLVEMFERMGRPFPNDHFDALFNAIVDASLVLGAIVGAASLAGLGTCPVSQIRNHAERIDALLALPPRVIPVAGLCLGWPAKEVALTPRLGLDVTTHENAFDGSGFAAGLAEYEARRAALKPLTRQRSTERFGTAPQYGWEDDKTRQYAKVQREDFGAYVRRKGFRLT